MMALPSVCTSARPHPAPGAIVVKSGRVMAKAGADIDHHAPGTIAP